MRAAVGAAIVGATLLASMAVADARAFDSRAAALERGWQADQAAGVPAEQLAAARDSLRGLRARHVGPLPYSVLSGALVLDPFTAAEAKAAAGARRHAEGSLARLRRAGGPNFDAQEDVNLLDRARQGPDYLRLARAWDAESRQLDDARDRLSAAAGGLSDGLPADVVDALARLRSVTSAASQAKLSTDPSSRATVDGQAYLKMPYPEELAGHADAASELQAAIGRVQHRIDARAQANQLVSQLSDLLNQAARYGPAGDLPARADQAGSDVRAAEDAQDDARMDAAVTSLQQVVDDLQTAIAAARRKAEEAALAAAGLDGACIDNAPAQLIVIHLATQRLVAFNNGCPMLSTLVTTGRPALPTDRGTFHVFAKYPSYHMISPWPPGSQFWYHDAWVDDAMEFVRDGTFLHGASWEPLSAYGPGSQDGPYASHGCVHVPPGPLATLYSWAQIGATVVVED